MGLRNVEKGESSDSKCGKRGATTGLQREKTEKKDYQKRLSSRCLILPRKRGRRLLVQGNLAEPTRKRGKKFERPKLGEAVLGIGRLKGNVRKRKREVLLPTEGNQSEKT